MATRVDQETGSGRSCAIAHVLQDIEKLGSASFSAVNQQIQSNQGGSPVRLHMWLDQNRNN